MIEVIESPNGKVKTVSDTINPQINFTYYRCEACNEWIDAEEAVWLDEFGNASQTDGTAPYHVHCAPEQKD